MVQTVFITLYKQIQALRRQEPPRFLPSSPLSGRGCQDSWSATLPGPLNGDGIFCRSMNGSPIWRFPKIGVFNPPKWMVKIMENPIKHGMIWGYHYFGKYPYGKLVGKHTQRKSH